MNAHEVEILTTLYHQRAFGRDSFGSHASWSRPMDVGGRDGSHHSATLRKLARRGWVLAWKLHAIYCPNGATERQAFVDGKGWVTTTRHEPYKGCRCKGSYRYHISPRALRFVFERVE